MPSPTVWGSDHGELHGQSQDPAERYILQKQSERKRISKGECREPPDAPADLHSRLQQGNIIATEKLQGDQFYFVGNLKM